MIYVRVGDNGSNLWYKVQKELYHSFQFPETQHQRLKAILHQCTQHIKRKLKNCIRMLHTRNIIMGVLHYSNITLQVYYGQDYDVWLISQKMLRSTRFLTQENCKSSFCLCTQQHLQYYSLHNEEKKTLLIYNDEEKHF